MAQKRRALPLTRPAANPYGLYRVSEGTSERAADGRFRGGDFFRLSLRRVEPALPGLVVLRRKHLVHVLGRHRATDEEALDLVAAELAQQPHLLIVFDALGHDAQAERVRERDDHRHDVAWIAGVAHAHDEAAIDLQGVDGKAREVGER